VQSSRVSLTSSLRGGHTLDEALRIAETIFEGDTRLQVLKAQLKVVLSESPSSAVEGKSGLEKILKEVSCDLVDVFSVEGTQAFLCTREVKLQSEQAKTIAFLVFRGTEPKDFRDIKTDARAALQNVNIDGEELEMHSGYLEAFELVRAEIEIALKKTKCDQLIITGHSLGGALAVVATRLLASDTTGACYTFGAPPIDTIAVQNQLKTPVYEIINEVDIVPRLPNPWLTTGLVVLLRLLRLVAKIFTSLYALLASTTWDEKLEAYVESMTRYRHSGYLSYLVGSGSSARLRYNVDAFDRLKWWASMMWKKGFGDFGKMVSDQSIERYVEKLKAHARSRR